MEIGEMPKKILIALPPTMLDTVDKIADNEHRTRSDLVREALRQYIDRFKHKKAVIAAAHTISQQHPEQHAQAVVTENIMHSAGYLGTASNRYDNGETYDGPLVP